MLSHRYQIPIWYIVTCGQRYGTSAPRQGLDSSITAVSWLGLRWASARRCCLIRHFTHTSCRAKVLEFHHSGVFGTERQVITTATAMCQDETQPFGFLLADFLFSSSHVFTVSPFSCPLPRPVQPETEKERQRSRLHDENVHSHERGSAATMPAPRASTCPLRFPPSMADVKP